MDKTFSALWLVLSEAAPTVIKVILALPEPSISATLSTA